MRIPADVILIWSGTHANIPSGYTRETSLDDKFPKAHGAANPNATGGNSTHTHTSPTHSHVLNAHTHTYSLTSAGITVYGIDPNSAESRDAIIDTHGHTGTSGALNGGTTSSDAVTYSAMSNKPPYNEVIFIKSGGLVGLPNNVIALFSKTSIPAGWQICNGSNGSPDLTNKYLKGASTDANAGGIGGNYTNTHDISHSHTAQSHTHIAANSSASSNTRGGGSNDNRVPYTHVHSVTLGAGTQAINASTDSLITVETVEPLYKKLLAIQNQNGRIDKPKSIIGLWLGTVGNIPNGWVICDGNNGTVNMTDYHLKIAVNTSEIGNIGGANTHIHSAQSHTHTSTGSHTHTGSCDAHTESVGSGNASNSTHRTRSGSVHPVESISSVSSSYASANTTANSSNNEPEYRVVAFIQFQKEMSRGGISMFF